MKSILPDLAEAITPGCRHDVIGIRPGEKLHEVLLAEDEARRTHDYDRFYIVQPHEYSNKRAWQERPVPEDFCYASNTNDEWLGVEELRRIVGEPAEASPGSWVKRPESTPEPPIPSPGRELR